MSAIHNVFVDLKIDTGPYLRAMRRVADDLHRSLHRQGVGFIWTKAGVKRGKAHRVRCYLCSPMANPKPLSINGHEYARRRRGRSLR